MTSACPHGMGHGHTANAIALLAPSDAAQQLLSAQNLPCSGSSCQRDMETQAAFFQPSKQQIGPFSKSSREAELLRDRIKPREFQGTLLFPNSDMQHLEGSSSQRQKVSGWLPGTGGMGVGR